VLRRCGLSIAPRFRWECLTNRTVSRFPAPATSHVACGFPALRAPAHFASRLMGPIPPERLPRPMADTILGTPKRVPMYRRAIPGSTASSPSLDAGTLGPDDAASSFLPSIGCRSSTARNVSWLPEKNPIHWPSGEKNGSAPFSIPGSSVGWAWLSKRMASSCLPSGPRAGKTSRHPSGEIATVRLMPVIASGPRSTLSRVSG